MQIQMLVVDAVVLVMHLYMHLNSLEKFGYYNEFVNVDFIRDEQ